MVCYLINFPHRGILRHGFPLNRKWQNGEFGRSVQIFKLEKWSVECCFILGRNDRIVFLFGFSYLVVNCFVVFRVEMPCLILLFLATFCFASRGFVCADSFGLDVFYLILFYLVVVRFSVQSCVNSVWFGLFRALLVSCFPSHFDLSRFSLSYRVLHKRQRFVFLDPCHFSSLFCLFFGLTRVCFSCLV